MPVRVYRSSDSGAPVLNGTAGSLVAVLRACLVDGYGSKPPAGWSMPYTDGGTPPLVAVFRQGAKMGLPQYHLRVRDDAPGAASGREARLRAFEDMTDLDTGINPFPTTGQLANGAVMRKSHTADATARTWLLVADERTFTLFVYHPSGFNTSSGSRADGYGGMYFGDYVPANPNYAYRAVLIAKAVENVTDRELIAALVSFDVDSSPGRVLAREYSGTVMSQPCDFINGGPGAQQASGTSEDRNTLIGGIGAASRGTFLVGANPADGRIWLSPIYLVHRSPSTVVGYLRGLWAPIYRWDVVADGAVIQGAGPTAGREFVNITPVRFRDGSTSVTSQFHGALCVETSNTWDS